MMHGRISRWGAFSVLDHTDLRKLAAEVLLYDHLLVPTPMAWDLERWHTEGWDPQGLEKTLAELGGIAIRASWDQERQKDWAARFEELAEDQRDINAGLQMTRRVLVEMERDYRPPGVSLVEAIAAYQTEADYRVMNSGAGHSAAARTMALIAHRVAVPDDSDPMDALKRAVDLAQSDTFRRDRDGFFDWQRSLLAAGQRPEDIAQQIPHLVAAYNAEAQKTLRAVRWETATLCLTLGLGAVGVAAGLAPSAFAVAGAGPLAGATVAQLGSFAGGAVIQILQHVAGRNEPVPAEPGLLAGAMFHQIGELRGFRIG